MSDDRRNLPLSNSNGGGLSDRLSGGVQSRPVCDQARSGGAANDAATASLEESILANAVACAEDEVQRLLAVVRTMTSETTWGTMQVIAIAHMLSTLRSVLLRKAG